MKAIETKPLHQKVNLHYHDLIISKESNILVLRVTSLCQKGADVWKNNLLDLDEIEHGDGRKLMRTY